MTQSPFKCNREMTVLSKNFSVSVERPAKQGNSICGENDLCAGCARICRFEANHFAIGRDKPIKTMITLFDDGIMAKTSQDLFAFLDSLGISHQTLAHEPVFTVSESTSLRDQIAGGHTKNLFVKDKKDRFFVITVEENATVDLKTVHKLIGASSRVSFGSAEKMLDYLGVVPGSVTVFGAINDVGNNVTFVLDEDLMREAVINGHPLSNDATTSIGREDLIRFLEATGHQPLVLKVTG